MNTEHYDFTPLLKVSKTLKVQRTGSSYTCNPPVLDTDVDYLVFVDDWASAVQYLAHALGWTLSSGNVEEYEQDEDYSDTWYACRKDQFNAMVTNDIGWYEGAVRATEVCKARNVLDKEDRKAIFRFMRDGIDEDACVAALKRWPA